jgi:hypothetical protein
MNLQFYNRSSFFWLLPEYSNTRKPRQNFWTFDLLQKLIAMAPNSGYLTIHGYICCSFRRSHFGSPANRCVGKTSVLNPERCSGKLLKPRRPPTDVGRDSGETCGCRQSPLGKAKGGQKNNSRQEKGWNHRRRTEKTFPANESTLGSKKESCEEVSQPIRTDISSFLLLRQDCSREDSNLHGFPHTVLSRTRLPVPPREQKAVAATMRLRV